MTDSEQSKNQITSVLASFGLPAEDAKQVSISELTKAALAQFDQASSTPEPHLAKQHISLFAEEEMTFPHSADLHMWPQHTRKTPVTQGNIWQGWEASPYYMGYMAAHLDPMMGNLQMPLECSNPWMVKPEVIVKPERIAKADKLVKAADKNRSAAATPVKETVHQFHKTRLCSFFQKGLCNRGSGCSFAHYGGELEGTPNLMKTSLCLAWKGGTCPLSAGECRFAHGKHDMRILPSKQSRQRLQKAGRDLLHLLNKDDAESHLQLEDFNEDTLGIDDILLARMEEREGKESGADNFNEDTFGAGLTNDWDYNQVLPYEQKDAVAPPPPPGLPPLPPGLSPSKLVASVPTTPVPTSLGSDAGVLDSDSDWSGVQDAPQATMSTGEPFQ